MRCGFVCCGLLLVLTTAAVAPADDKADPKVSNPPLEKYLSLGSVTGVVQSAPGDDGVVKIQVTIRYLEPNAQAQASYLAEERQLLARQAAALRIRNPLLRQRELLNILQTAQGLDNVNLFTVKEVKKEIAFETVDETKFRTASLPIAFDDKGDPRKYTRDELKELKGPNRLPGYTADRGALRSGQTVLIMAARRKPAKGEKNSGEETPIATLILITGEP